MLSTKHKTLKHLYTNFQFDFRITISILNCYGCAGGGGGAGDAKRYQFKLESFHPSHQMKYNLNSKAFDARYQLV